MSKRLFIGIFLLPALIIYSVFYMYPLLSGFRVVFYESKAGFLDTFVGLKNFKTLLGFETFRTQLLNALGNNFKFLIISLIAVNILALILSYEFSIKRLWGGKLFQNVLFAPQVVPIITVGFICSLIFNPSLGSHDKIVNLLGLPLSFTNLLGKAETALYTFAGIEVIRLVGFPLTIYFVAVNGISQDFIDAASIDTNKNSTILLRIVLPIISPTIIMTNILMIIGSFIYFDLVYVLQGYLGGPSFSTDVLGVFFYRVTFGGHHGGGDAGIGAVISLFIFFILAVFTLAGLALYKGLRDKLR
jgi:raffinose/stachyose/melibiose transport system permease protein